MTEIDGRPDGLILTGYRPLSRSGFALPCYAVRPQANAWYVASCSIEGDHSGKVTGFDIYDDAEVVALPEDLHRRVRIGEPWVDVFLWNGPRVGTPDALIQELRSDLKNLTDVIPLSLLDLMLSAGEQGLRGLMDETSRHVERGHGPEVAATWRRDLIATQARLALRRQLASSLVVRALVGEARRLRVEEASGRVLVWLPHALASTLAPEELEQFRERLNVVADRLGVSIECAVDAEQLGPLLSAPAVSFRENHVAALDDGGVNPSAEVRILVVYSGTRARAISRHLSPPDWSPIDHNGDTAKHWVVRTGREVGAPAKPGVSLVDVIGEDGLPVSATDYASVVWLLDDELIINRRLDHLVGEFDRLRGGNRNAVHLLAPALPTYEPSRVLSTLDTDTLSFPCAAVIDTSLARSPFWTGNPWRAIDRRIADTLVGAALVAATDLRVRKALLGAGPEVGSRLFSHALGSGDLDSSNPELGLLSETSTFGLEAHEGGDLTFHFNLVPLDKSVRVGGGYAALRRADRRFLRFVEAVMASIQAGPGAPANAKGPLRRSQVAGGPSGRIRKSEESDAATVDLRAPQFTARLLLDGSLRIMITAEAPSPKAVRSALEQGWAAARYTDRETISEILAGEHGGLGPPLPREFRLPKLQRLPVNRGLAVRGIDPRDVVMIPIRDAPAWFEANRESPLSTLGREYQERIDQTWVLQIAFPRAAVQAGLASGDPAAVQLVQISEAAGRRTVTGPLKRPKDLGASWSELGEGESRFILEDGQLPVRMAELSPGVVPAQRMFILDGDASVPMLFTSRLFAVWARATTSRSTSWLSRFSVSRTFETMPVPKLFHVVRNHAGRAQLRRREDNSDLAELAVLFQTFIVENRRGGDHESNVPLPVEAVGVASADLDALLLGAIDLRPNAPDVEVLDRLLSLNNRAPGLDD